MVYFCKTLPVAYIPTRGTKQSAGLDLYSPTDACLKKGEVTCIDLGITALFPPGTYGRIASRSSLAKLHCIFAEGGVIDEDYRGNISIILYNGNANKDYEICAGDRVAQLVLEKYSLAEPVEVSEFSPQLSKPETSRGVGGFGSTGK